MKWLTGYSKKREVAKGFSNQQSRQTAQTFILEPILTPSGILDGGDDTPDPLTIDWETNTLPEVDTVDNDVAQSDISETNDDFDADINQNEIANNTLETDISDEDLETVDFIENLDNPETESDEVPPQEANESETLPVDSPKETTDSDIELSATANNENAEEIDNTKVEITNDSDTKIDETDDSEQVIAETETDSNEELSISDSANEVNETDSTLTGGETDETPATIVDDLSVSEPNFDYDSGVFTVGETGEVGIDFLFDGGKYKGELAIFSLDGMDEFEPGSQEFIQEAVSRSLSNSELGHVVISDASEGAKFSGNLGEANFNSGTYSGVKTFAMRPGDTFAVMLIPNGKVEQVFNNPAISGALRPLFSLVTFNPNDAFHVGQIADVTGDGNTFVMEDVRVDSGSDRDYNDIIFQVRGATAKAALMDDVVADGKDWRGSDLGQALIAYAEPYIEAEIVDDVELIDEEISVDDLILHYEVVENPSDESLPVNDNQEVSDEPIDEKVAEDSQEVSDESTEEKVVVDKPELSDEEVEEIRADSEIDEKEIVSSSPAEDVVSDGLEDDRTLESVSPTSANNENDAVDAFAESDEVIEVTDSQITTKPVDVEDTVTKDKIEEVVSREENAIASSTITTTQIKTEVAEIKPAVTVNNSSPTVVEEVAVENVSTSTLTPVVAETKNVDSVGELKADSSIIKTVETGNGGTQTNVINSDVVVTENKIAFNSPITSTAETTSAVTVTETQNPAVITPLPAVSAKPPIQFEFPQENQPLVGIIDKGFSANNPDIDYSRIILGQDRVDGDANPLVVAGEGDTSGTSTLGIIGATQNNKIGINGINDDAPLWVGRAEVNSDQWAQSLMEFVDGAKTSKQPNAVVNLSFNLTNPDGTHRFELTGAERAALAYAQQHNVLIVASAGDNPGEMSAVGQASLEFDNIVTVGSAERVNNSVALSKAYDRAKYSGSGYALDIVAPGGTDEKPITVTSGNGVAKEFGTLVATAKVGGAASQVWAANPDLSYRQVIDILKRTATDLKTPNWDLETGAGLLNIAAAVHLAKVTPAIDVDVPVRYDFKKSDQPLIGIIDTGFNGKNPDIDYSRIISGRDLVDGDTNPLLETGQGNEHGTHVLGIIGATQSNGIGIDGMNDDAPIWLGRAVGSGKWAESLREFVNAAKASSQPNAVVNLSFDLTQINPDGSVTTRYELTPQEREALEYARQNGMMVVVAAGNDGGTMSALGQASQEFDNLITVGSVDDNGQRAAYASFGYGLDLVARGGSEDNQILATVGDGNDLKMLMGEEELPDDEMSVNLINAFENYLPGFKDAPEIDEDEDLSDFTPEEREAYEQATREIDASLSEYLAEATQKIAIEYAEGYVATQVEALESFVEAFDEDMPDVLMKAQELLQQSGFSADIKLDENEFDFAVPLDFGIGGMAGTSVAAAKVTGIVSQVWAANPDLSYVQVKEILKKTAVDLGQTGWDLETGAGLVNTAAAIDLARKTVPEAYQPQPIQSPTTWSGQDKVIPSERPVAVSVPPFTGRVMGAGYVTTVGFQRIRSGPGTGYAEVGQKYPGEAITFDAYENNGGLYSDPYVASSSRWYKIAGTNNWMWAGYIDNSPELAEQERQRQEAIRRAEEEARRAEEEARRAEEELRRIEEELRRAEEEARRRAEEEARQRQEQLQKAVQQVQSKLGSLGAPIGSSLSNGVSVYTFDKGSLLIQADGRFSFYENPENVTAEGLIINRPYVIDKFLGSEDPWKNSLEQTAFLLSGGTKNLGVQDLLSGIGRKLAYSATSPGENGFLLPRWGSFSKSLDDGLGLFAKTSQQWDDIFASSTAKLFRINPTTKFGTLYTKAAKNAGVFGAVLGLAPLAYEYFSKSDPEEKQKVLVKGAFDTAGTLAGAALFSLIPVPGATLVGGFVGGWLGSMAGDWVNENGASTGKAIVDAIGIGVSAVSSFGSNTVELLKQKAKAAKEKAQTTLQQAKAAYQTAQAAVQTAKAAYQTFKQETQQKVTQIVQQSKQKIQQEAQRVAQVVAQTSQKVGQKVAQTVVNYAKKAVNTVTNIINGGKQFVTNMVNTGKQIVNNIVDTGKKAYQAAKTFVTNTYETGKKVVAETAKVVNNAVNTVANTVSNGWNKAKSLFGW
ncbi:hypothetical protein NIES2119_30170 [[Phormidium ambiguum] IAM M-71]|uniref:DUF4114 domain-containing protein n=1 Tax=[Phormidium ambiguum] IAM M-71 TaxID=454136 RepID=A0A1U7I3V9_9CYAN|nr:S8 family serine peptidase [Phormidium ambiguum]OKH30842.1 hypothetical protein NIES2119_30170 [Phormidium ambiguum IAM M-71]